MLIARATQDPAGVAARVARDVSSSGATVKNIRDQAQQTTSSITTIDLTGISRIEEVFAIALASAALALFVTITIAERRHEFATMAALGASLREIGWFLWSEIVVVLAAAVLLAVGLGWLLSLMLVAMLQHVFDPPPDHLAVPWMYLGALLAAAILAALVSATWSIRSIGRMPLGAILREE